MCDYRLFSHEIAPQYLVFTCINFPCVANGQYFIISLAFLLNFFQFCIENTHYFMLKIYFQKESLICKMHIGNTDTTHAQLTEPIWRLKLKNVFNKKMLF